MSPRAARKTEGYFMWDMGTLKLHPNYQSQHPNETWTQLDWESIRSSPRDGSSTFYRLTKVGWVLVGGWVWWVGWLAPKISVSSSGILRMVHQIRLMMFSLKMVDYSMSFLLLSTWIFFWRISRVDYSGPFLFSELFCGTPPSCLKVGGWWVGGWPTGF